MLEDNEINIKLELIKEKDQNLSIITYFNKNSTNFYEKDNFYIWKPNNREKNFIIEAFKLLLDNDLQNANKKVFKFSDKLSDDTKVNEKSLINNQTEELTQDLKVNNSNIINESIDRNKIEKSKFSKIDQDEKIEKILMENHK